MRSRKIIRLKGHDYSQSAYYFVTFHPECRKYPFCEIINDKVYLLEIGKVIEERWKWLFEHFDYIKMDEYIIMPDHFHGIIRMLPERKLNVGTGLDPSLSSKRATQESPVHLIEGRKFSISNIIGAFKTTSSKQIHIMGYPDFKWKRSFHDRIIRIDELDVKRRYIRNNPKNFKVKEKTV